MPKLKAILISSSSVPKDFDLTEFAKITVEKLRGFCDEIFSLNSDIEGTSRIDFSESKSLFSFISDSDADQLLFLNAFSPMLDLKNLSKMIDEHIDLTFDYTYAENLPEGLLPEIISPEAAGFIARTLPGGLPIIQNSLKEAFESSLSSYDTNIFILPSELLFWRVNFTPRSLGDALVLSKLTEKLGSEASSEEIEAWIRKNPHVIRSVPSFYEIQLTTFRESGEIFASDAIEKEGEMDYEKLSNLLSKICSFSHSPSVLFGLFGEPFLHSKINEILDLIKNYPQMNFYFESRGFLTNFEPVKTALSLPNVRVIFDVSFMNEEDYKKFKKPSDEMIPFESLAIQTEKIKALPAEKVFIQLTRAKQNEEILMKFYETWRNYGERILIRALDVVSEDQKNFRVVDLAPLKRSFSLHLKHDFYIRFDGEVQIHRSDVAAQHSLGNAFLSLSEPWEKMNAFYLQEWSSDFTEPQFLYDYPDWWVFNF